MHSIIAQWQNGVGEIHFLLAIVLFFLINFIGNKSYSIGYMPISLLVKDESSLAFNFVIRVATPVIYIIITSSIAYYLKADFLIQNYYFIVIYYLIIQYLLIFIDGRSRLINWKRQIFYSLSIIILSYFIFIKFINIKKNLLPDFSNVANEMWIIIILFIYKIINELEISLEGSVKRKNDYIYRKFLEFRNNYSFIVNKEVNNDVLKSIIYAIMIYEDFNRSRIVRIIENASFYINKRPHTLGIMQVTTDKFIDDNESVLLGVERIKKVYDDYLIKVQSSERSSSEQNMKLEDIEKTRSESARNEIISNYNTGNEYYGEVMSISDILLGKFYPNTKDKLDSEIKE